MNVSGGLDIQVLLAVAYALFLGTVAAVLELLARHSHRRSERLRVAGFRYDADLDLWTCPRDENLVRVETDFARRIVVYRAEPHICNRCDLKHRCTDSQAGRSIEHHSDSWLQSEVRRFHRGLSLVLLTLALLLLSIEWLSHPGTYERALLGFMLAAIASIVVRLARTLGTPIR